MRHNIHCRSSIIPPATAHEELFNPCLGSNIEKNLMFVEEITQKEILRALAKSSEMSYFAKRQQRRYCHVLWKKSREIIKVNCCKTRYHFVFVA